VTKVVQRQVQVPYEVPVEIQHEQIVVQPINVIEQEVVQVNRRVEAGAAYVAGEQVVNVQQRHVVVPQSGVVATNVVGIRQIQGGAVGIAGNSALALDAADGVIDGRFYGAPIVGAGVPQATALVARHGYQVQRQPVGIVGGYQTTVGGSNAAARALDAADGVIDGRFFGRPVVPTGFNGATAL